MLKASFGAGSEINCQQTAWHNVKEINICKRKRNRLLTALRFPRLTVTATVTRVSLQFTWQMSSVRMGSS